MNIHAANQRLREARETLKAADAALARALTLEDQGKSNAEAATVAEVDCAVPDALVRASERRDAETILAAAGRNVAAARRAQSAAMAEVKAADYSAVQAAYRIISVEASLLARDIAHDEAVLKAKRDRLNAVRDLPDFVPTPNIARAIGDDVHTPICDIASPANLDTPLNEIGLIRNSVAAVQSWRARVDELLRDQEGTEGRNAA